MAEKKTPAAEPDYSSFRKVHKVEVKHEHTFKFTKKAAALIVLVVILIACGITGYVLTSNNDGYSVKVSDNKKLITGDVTITKQGYFENMLKSSGLDADIRAFPAMISSYVPISISQDCFRIMSDFRILHSRLIWSLFWL